MHLPHPDLLTIQQKLEEALNAAKRMDMFVEVAHCHLALAKLFAQLDKVAEAKSQLEQASQYYEKLEMAYWVCRSKELQEQCYKHAIVRFI